MEEGAGEGGGSEIKRLAISHPYLYRRDTWVPAEVRG